MDLKRFSVTVLSALCMTSCVMIDQYREAAQYDMNSSEAKQCEYEAKSATASMPNNSRSGVNFEQMFKEKELFNLCMKNKSSH